MTFWKIAVVGNVDAGKSTLLGVLTHGDLDNGRGHSRQKLFRHKHEIESGRTSSVGNDILGFDSKGNIVNQMEAHNGHIDWKRICQNSAKVITFIDLAGHEKYLKTTIFGMTGHYPDFVMLMIGANAGIVGMTKEHLGLALALNMPVFVVLTKTDMCPANVLADNVKLVAKVLKSAGCRKIPIFVNSNEDVVKVSDFVSQRTCPIFQVSNVTGQNIDLLKSFLNLLTPSIPSVSCSRREHFDIEKPAELLIDDYYQVPGVGTVVSGTCINGIMKVGDTFLLGPDRSGNFNPVNIRSIHRKRMPVEKVSAGQSASMALKKVRKNDVRKGMVLVSPAIQPKSYWEFNANVLILHHPTTIKPKYQAMIHCGSVRQTATLLEMSLECLRTGDRALVRFRFTKQPEFLRCGQKIVFREGRTKAIGSISELL
ncbi:GTP-binding protein 1-like [Gordionus sp. m RMFG-2023]|uniref:GTP-binding protein 1-like n=1 Tax=Gordionus sp. m RMFG-2023 TaxID=3053472 RepID=UPI0031FD18B8